MKTSKTIIGMCLMVVVLAGAALMAPVSTASADSGGGTGWLDASGTGTAGVRGTGSITVSGAGALWVKDLAGDASIDGNASISGSSVEAKITGANIHLYAEGTGVFYVRGRGSYSTSHRSGDWPPYFRRTFDLE